MVQGINPIGTNSTATTQVTPPSASSSTAKEDKSTSQQMTMMPSIPMPADMINTSLQTPSEIKNSQNSQVDTTGGAPATPASTTAPAGAQNLTTPASTNGVGVLNPPNVSTNPLQDRYGFIKDDPYGLNNPQNQDTQLIASQGLNLFPEASAYYNPDKPASQSPLAAFGIGGTNGTTKQSGGLGSILKTAVFAVAGLVLFKSIRGRKAKVISDALGGAKNTVSQRIVKEFDEFKDFFTDTMDNLADLTPKTADNIKMNLSGRTLDETKGIIDKTRRLATEYSRLPGMRPKYVVYLKEGMEPSQDALIDALKRNDLSGISDDILRGIEEIDLIAEKIAPSTELQSNILFNPVVRENFSTHNNTEMFGLAGKNLRTRISNFLAK